MRPVQSTLNSKSTAIPIRTGILKIIIIIIAILPAAIYYQAIIRYSVNVPHWDDYDAIIKFLLEYAEATTVREKLKLIVSQHNEHRIVFDRVVFLINDFFGRINFKGLVIFGNLALLFIMVILFVSYNNGRYKLLYFLPVPFLVFQLQNYDNSLWAMASIQNYYVILFAITSIYLLTLASPTAFAGSVCFAAAATFTSGNGMFVFPLGFVYLLTSRPNPKKLAIWTISGFVFVYFYFRDYTRPSGHPDIIVTLLDQPDILANHFILLLGSSTRFITDFGLLLTVLLGVFLVLSLLYLFQKQGYQHSPALFYILLFLFMSVATTSLTRAGFGTVQAFSTRYRIYSLLIISVIYLSVERVIPIKARPYYLSLFVLFSLFLNWSAFNTYDSHMRHWSNTFLYDAAVYNADTSFASVSHYAPPVAKERLRQFVAKGYYQVPDPPINIHAAVSPANLSTETNNVTFYFDNIIGEGQRPYLKITGWAITKGIPSSDSHIFLIFHSNTHTFSISTLPIYRDDVTTNFSPKRQLFHDKPIKYFDHKNLTNYNNSGFFMFLKKQALPPGVYRLGILISREDGTHAFKFTDKEITI